MTARVSNRRIRLLVLVFAALLLLALLRAAWLQAVRSPSLTAQATSQQQVERTIPPRRGTIYDAKGRELAIGEKAVTVYANPRQIRAPGEVAKVVAADLKLPEDEVLAKLRDRSKGFVYLGRKLDPDLAGRLADREIVGIGFQDEERRLYPQKAVAAEVVGYAGTDNNGLAGIEFGLDGALAGKPGTETTIQDPAGQTLDVVESTPVVNGRDVYLTIDHRVQAYVERVLRETRAAWGAKAATAVVLVPQTGEVLAMASEPGFDANRFSSASPDATRNRAVTDTYEPGSTFKVLTIGAALEERLVKPATSFVVPDEIQVSDRLIHDAETHPTLTMSVAEILAHSSNVGTIQVAQRLGEDALADWIDRFGFGHETGIEFPGETEGIVLPRERWSGSTIGNVPIGQGIAVTPIQMAAMFGAIANDGVWVQPHLVERIGARRVAAAGESRRVFSVKTARTLRWMLGNVVSNGTGDRAVVPGYKVAGKTGTASKVDPDGTYSRSRYVASFIGMAPARHPRVVILVSIDEPRGAIFGGKVAAPAFAKIASFALQYLEVPPDRSAADPG